MERNLNQPAKLTSALLMALGLSTLITHSQSLQRIWSQPRVGTFYSMQLTNLPPLPFLPDFLDGVPVYLNSTNAVYFYDDRNIDYIALTELQQTLAESVQYPPYPGEGIGGGSDTNTYAPGPLGEEWGPNDLWLEITRVTNNLAYLVLHNTQQGSLYQLWSKAHLSDASWTPGQIVKDLAGTNQISFDPVPTFQSPTTFFRASGPGNWDVQITVPPFLAEPTEPDGPGTQPRVGHFWVTASNFVNTNLVVSYRIGGSASNGLDYTNITGQVTIPAGTHTAAIFIHPNHDGLVEFDESVILTLLPGPGYVVKPGFASAGEFVTDSIGTNVIFETVATNVPSLVGIDYHPPSKRLMLSVNYPVGFPYTFATLSTNHIRQQWSQAIDLSDEIQFATAKQSTNGFTNGEIFCGATTTSGNTSIAWVAANGSAWTNSWVTLPGETDILRGGICIDNTGVWGGDIIAVTGADGSLPGTRGIWRLNRNGNPTLITRIDTRHLEGVTTLPNDYQRWGPLAGTIVTGDENLRLVYAINTNAIVSSFALGIDPDDFDVCPATDEDLYCVNFDWNLSRILKVRKGLLSAHAGDLLITQTGEVQPRRPALFLVRWGGSDLILWRIILPATFSGIFEHVTFAPISLSPL